MCVNLLKYTEHYVVDNHSLCMDIIIVVIVIITIIIIIIIVFRVRAMFINLPGLITIVSLCCMIGHHHYQITITSIVFCIRAKYTNLPGLMMIVILCCVIGDYYCHNHRHCYHHYHHRLLFQSHVYQLAGSDDDRHPMLYDRSFYAVVFCFRAMFVNLPGLIMIVSLCCMIGVVMFAFYADCHPIEFGVIKKTDQVITHFHSMEHGQCWVHIFNACRPTDVGPGWKRY